MKIPTQVRGTAERLGAVGRAWLDDLPGLVSQLATEWSISVGEPLGEGFTGVVFDATDADGRDVVLKLGVPDGLVGISPFSQELDVLLLAGGPPYVRVLQADRDRRAMVMERHGRPLGRLGLPTQTQLHAIARTLPAGWKRVPDATITRGDEKAAWLREFIERRWTSLGEPCTRRTVDLAVAYTHHREDAFDADTAVLIHGDAHQYNILETHEGSGTYTLIDPEGLISEPAHDLAIPLRLGGDELLAGDCVDLLGGWCDTLADATDVDRTAIWEWAFIERVSTGFNFASFGMHGEASKTLRVADVVSDALG